MSQSIPIIFVGRVPDIALGIIEEMKPEIEGNPVFSSTLFIPSLHYLFFDHDIIVSISKLMY
jgi:hypothetical protein